MKKKKREQVVLILFFWKMVEIEQLHWWDLFFDIPLIRKYDVNYYTPLEYVQMINRSQRKRRSLEFHNYSG